MERNSINTLHGQVTVGTLILQVGIVFWLFDIQLWHAKFFLPHQENYLRSKSILSFYLLLFVQICIYLLNTCVCYTSLNYCVLSGLCCRFAVCFASSSWWYFWHSSRSDVHDKIVRLYKNILFRQDMRILPYLFLSIMFNIYNHKK